MANKVGDAPNQGSLHGDERQSIRAFAQLMSPSYVNPATTIVYERLDVSIVGLETKRSLKVIRTDMTTRSKRVALFLVSEYEDRQRAHGLMP